VFELRLKMENFEGDEQQARLGRVREQFDIILSQAQQQDQYSVGVDESQKGSQVASPIGGQV